MKLYTHPFSPNCRKVHSVAAALGSDIEQEIVNLQEGQQRTPEFIRLNPNSKVPVLVDGDTTLWESNAICCYLAGKQDTDMWPKSAARYDILRWMFWEAAHLSDCVGTLFGQKFFAKEPDQAVIDKALGRFTTLATVLNNHLESNQYLTGDAITIADPVVAVWLGYEQACNLPLGDLGHVTRWRDEVYAGAGGAQLAPPMPK